MEDEFYDLVYEAYMTGKDPDAVAADSYEDQRSRGYYPDEISLNDVYTGGPA